jgi:hypothetical protein
VSLPVSSREYEGQLLCFEPRHGWGWFLAGVPDAERHLDYAVVDAAGAFHIRVHRFFDFEGMPRGLVGRVEQPGHLFDGLWAATWTMNAGEFDVVENLCLRWDMELGPTEPRFADGWPVTPDAPPAYAGFGGVLAVSHAAIKRFYEVME